jgi:hypothetical protein
MIAILLNNGYVKGVFPDYTENVEIMGEFVLVSELPAVFIDLPENVIVKYEGGEFQRVDLPPKPPDRISQLESDNAFLALQLADTQARLDVSEQAQADLILSLVEKGVL